MLALFQKRFEGDDALLRLAQLCFEEAGLGAEFYAETPGELKRLLGFMPSAKAPSAVHLGRKINLLDEAGRRLVVDFAESHGGRVFGLVVHDQPEAAGRPEDYVAALREVESGLRKTGTSQCLFIEYASGLEPEAYVDIFRKICDLKRVSACIDIGHIGLRQARAAYMGGHPGEDICSLGPDEPALPELLDDIQGAVRSATDVVLQVIRELAPLGKPLHFHLHDAHPLSTRSPFGVSDHLGFQGEIPIPFKYDGKRSLGPMFGPLGLAAIVRESVRLAGPERVSFSLEIHPAGGRRPLGETSHLFSHWADKANAERMNAWLLDIMENHQLLIEALGDEEAL
jgi:hypothetical protein